MPNEDVAERTIARGRRIEQLLANSDLVDLFEELDAESVANLRRELSAERREGYWHEMQALDRIRSRMGIVIERGKHAQIELERTQKRSP